MDSTLQKEFPMSDMLGALTGRLVCRRKIQDFFEFLEFVAGDDAYRRQIPEVLERCRPHLILQLVQKHPHIEVELAFAVEELDEKLKTKNGKRNERQVAAKWLEKLLARYGTTCLVRPISKASRQVWCLTEYAPDKVHALST